MQRYQYRRVGDGRLLNRPGYADDLRMTDGREPALVVRKTSLIPMGGKNTKREVRIE